MWSIFHYITHRHTDAVAAYMCELTHVLGIRTHVFKWFIFRTCSFQDIVKWLVDSSSDQISIFWMFWMMNLLSTFPYVSDTYESFDALCYFINCYYFRLVGPKILRTSRDLRSSIYLVFCSSRKNERNHPSWWPFNITILHNVAIRLSN